MDHADHVNLLRNGVPGPGGVWADFGAGRGAFTLALADLVGDTAEVYALDQDAGALETNARSMRTRFPDCRVQYEVGDYTQPQSLPVLDGIVMANTLHFQADPVEVVRLCRGYLRAGGRLLLVEYNLNQSHRAVPYPVTYLRWQSIARDAGFEQTTLLATRPSRFLREIYAAASW
jgi:ubiquinone/menaquinone biosynthesis C-methylase UbiE